MVNRKVILRISLFSVIFISFVAIYSYSYISLKKQFETTETKTINTKQDDSVLALFEKGEHFFSIGEYQKAIDVYNEIIILDPKNINAHLAIADTYRYWGKFEESEKWFFSTITLNPNDASLYTDLGKLYRNMNLPDKAEEVFKKAIEINPTYDLVYSYGFGTLYFDQKRYEESEKMFLKGKELNPESDFVYMGLGDLYREMGKYEESESMYKKAFLLNPKSESFLGLGWLYIYQERYHDAVATLEKYLAEIREKGEVYNALAQAYIGLGEYAEAKKAYVRALELNPGNTIFQDGLRSIEAQETEE